MIPSFAIGRVEELLYWLQRLEKEARIPSMPTYVDSPMAAEAINFYSSRPDELDPEHAPGTSRADVRHATPACDQGHRGVQGAHPIERSGHHHLVEWDGDRGPGAAPPEANMLPDPKNTVLFVGFQAAGTRGRLLVDGAKTVKIHGEVIPVAARVVKNDQMSAHADRDEILRWLRGFSRPPAQTFLVHGEPDAMGALASAIRQELGWSVHQPQHREHVMLAAAPA